MARPIVQSASRSRTRELTEGNIPRQVLIQAIPSTFESVLMNIVRLLDTYWMGRVGGMAIASVAMATTLRMVLITPMMGLSMGGQAVVARYVGAKDEELAGRAVMQCLLLIILFTVPLMLIGYLGFTFFLQAMGAKGEVLEGSRAFLQVLFAGLFFTECLPTMCGVIRGAGRPEYTLCINAINLFVLAVMEPILVLGLGPFPALGVRGAALASVSGAVAGVLGVFYILATGKTGVRPHWRQLRPDLTMIKRILKISIPNSMERFSPNMGAAVFMRLISALGNQVLTAYSIYQQLWGFTLSLSMGAGTAAATMVGQNLGARKPERSEKAAYVAALGAGGVSIALYAILALAARHVIGIFSQDVAVISIASIGLAYAVLNAAARGWGQVLGRALGGAGDAIWPMIASIVALWAVQIPACWQLSSRIGPIGVWISIILGDFTYAAITTWRFRKGLWKHRTL